MAEIPKTRKYVTLEKQPDNQPSSAHDTKSTTYHKLLVKECPFELPKTGKEDDTLLTIKVKSFAFNHRDLWMLKGQYPKIEFGSTLGSDCVGTVIHPKDHALFEKDVLVYPAVNWLEDARGPDGSGKPFGILGGTSDTDGIGTFTDLVNIRASHCVPSPSHLNPLNASAVPLAGLTAFRAVFTKAQITKSSNVLITGIGGGVAIWALQFCNAVGANAWVTSSSEDKINQARRLGAKGGVSYKQDDWPTKLASLLPSENPFLDAVIDSAGGDISPKCRPLLRHGGIIVNFGATTGIPLSFTMAEVLKNLELRGCTMGSLREFKEMVALVEKHKIEPVVYKTLHGFEQVEEGFQILKSGQQFGKIVVVIDQQHAHKT